MRILAAIGRVLAALAIVVVEWCEWVGKFVIRCMPGYQPPDPDDLVEAYAEAAEEAAVTPAADQRLENIRLIAHALAVGGPIPDRLFEGVGQPVVHWLGAMDKEMLLSMSEAKPEALRLHMRGEKAIRGLLAYNLDAIAAYRATVAQTRMEPEFERVHRRPRRQEPLLPVFGPMC